MPQDKLKAWLTDKAKDIGFDTMRITGAELDPQHGKALDDYIRAQYHGDMGWLKETAERRLSPEKMWCEAKTAIILGTNYGPGIDPLENLEHPDHANISVYARHRDYHDLIKGRMKQLAGGFVAQCRAMGLDECEIKVFVDTAPLMEKPLAQKAGLGWAGKHTNLVSKDYGSWLFLGVILTNLELQPDKSEDDHCGSCRKCLDICPTDAFPKPYQIDARRCISYLTIENDGPIPVEFRKAIQNRIYGCDDCLAVCPWNKFAQTTHHIKLQARDDLLSPKIKDLLKFDEGQFRHFFSGSPIKRIRYPRFMRNVLIAAANSADLSLLPYVLNHITSPNPIIRGAAIWAFKQLGDKDLFTKYRAKYISDESDPSVKEEWSS